MSDLQQASIQKLSIDIYDEHMYESIYTKQYDENRKVYFTITRNNIPLHLDNIIASFEMKKNDGTVVIKHCDIENDEVIVSLDKNITVFFGNRIPFQLKLVDAVDDMIITTVTGYLHIEESVIKLDDIESTSDFSTYSEILLNISQKYEETKQSEENAKQSELKAKESELAALQSKNSALESQQKALESETKAKLSETNSAQSEANSKASEEASKASEEICISKAEEASKSAEKAEVKANESSVSESNAKSYMESALNFATNSENYAIGNTNSAKYYYEQAKSISESISGALRPKGTVTFANLPSISSATEGDMYNISDEFVTTSDFKEGEGKIIPSGSNVYKTSDEKWDILAGTPVVGVKGANESTYRRGNINITANDVGFEIISITEPSNQEIGCYWLVDY